jgi:hypothetical protein
MPPNAPEASLSRPSPGSRRSSELALGVVLVYVVVILLFFAAGFLVGRLLL